MSSVASTHADHPLRGISLLLCALLLFAGMDTTSKFLGAFYAVPLILAVRYIMHCLLMFTILLPSQGKRLLRTQRTGLVLVRAASLALASILVNSALLRMPIAEASSIVFLSPVLVMLLAGPLLGERIGGLGWLATLLGFGGVLLIIRPSGGLDTLGVIFALGAALATTLYFLLSRVLATTESTAAMQFYAALVGAVIFGLTLPWYWPTSWPGLTDSALLLSLGVYAGLGHFLLTAAYRYAPASLLAPINYLQLLWAGLLGWLVFGDIPDALSLLGMLVVAFSGVLIALKSRFYANQLSTKSTETPGFTPTPDNCKVL